MSPLERGRGVKVKELRTTLAQQQLARRLKLAREQAGMTQEDVAAMLGKHWSTMSRIENGRAFVSQADVREMGRIYRLGAQETESLVDLARGARMPGWTEPFHQVMPRRTWMLADLEATATRILQYSESILPGLLQTPDYARHVVGLDATVSPEVKEGRLAFRLERQRHVFEREKPAEVRFVLQEATLRFQFSDPELLPNQMSHLLELSRRRGVEIRVRPFAAGLHAWTAGGFTVLAFSGQISPGVVYTESQLEARYAEEQGQVAMMTKAFSLLWRASLPVKEFVS
jgi:transcriptional regulator with XRE-family HTH domain